MRLIWTQQMKLPSDVPRKWITYSATLLVIWDVIKAMTKAISGRETGTIPTRFATGYTSYHCQVANY